MQKTIINKFELSIIPKGKQYSILYTNNGKQWIHNGTHEHLVLAKNFLNKIIDKGTIDLRYWVETDKSYDFILLVNERRLTQNKVHIWNRIDSYCNNWSTGGLKQDRHILVETPPAEVFCSICVDQYRKHGPKQNQKVFDIMYRLQKEQHNNLLDEHDYLF